jgi:hypothetical protein
MWHKALSVAPSIAVCLIAYGALADKMKREEIREKIKSNQELYALHCWRTSVSSKLCQR